MSNVDTRPRSSVWRTLEILRQVSPTPDRVGKKWSVVYFPAFDSSVEYTSHRTRAKWYAPFVRGQCEAVHFAKLEGVEEMAPPSSMANASGDQRHLSVHGPTVSYGEALRDAHVILVWKALAVEERQQLESLLGGKRLVFVPTADLNEKEYGNYCKLMWRLLSRDGRDKLLERSHQKFMLLTEPMKRSKRSAVVLGTGPSIDIAAQFDFSEMNVIACNTIVQSEQLLDCVKPKFICAGDVISHFGVSQYAHKFRQDLVKVLTDRDIHFFTTAQFGYLLMLHHPEVADKILICNQTSGEPVYDLAKTWELPQLDSTLNIHMLPIASSIADEIFILGCDGKSPDESKNEDFWAHSASAQYHGLVDSGHDCHPTFKIHRARSILKGFMDGTSLTISGGEKLHGKRYVSLMPSYTPCIGERLADATTFNRLAQRDAGRSSSTVQEFL